MNKTVKIVIVITLIVVVGIVIALKQNKPSTQPEQTPAAVSSAETPPNTAPAALPRLVDLGADKCIPCKLMAPMLEELRKEYAGRLKVEFIDVWKKPDMAAKYGIDIIPTQIFFDSSGKERFRHEGFFSKEDILSRWKQLGVDLTSDVPVFNRLDPLVHDTRPTEAVCYLCDGDIDRKTRVTLKTDKGDVYLCCPHCYFITYSSLLEKQGMKVFVTDWSTGRSLAAATAVYLYGMGESGRPTVRAFADKKAALKGRKAGGGSILDWQRLKNKELAARCGFCDRAVYPEDAALVKAGGLYTFGCCPMCALGVAARTQKDIEIFQKDALTGEIVHVKTTNGSISLLEPKNAVAWSGKKKSPDGKLVSAGCFKQAFFVSENNLGKWVEQNPLDTGKMISIHQTLAAKMKLSPKQISKACKIGECSPK